MIDNLSQGIAFHKIGKLEDAKKIYEAILKSNPNNFEVINLLGVVFLQLKKYDNAITLITRAIDINPDHPSLYNNLGATYKELGDYNSAIKNFKKTIELNPNYAGAYNNLGIIFKKNYQYKESYYYYQQSIKLNPNYAETYNNLGSLYLEIKDFDKANINFNKAIVLKPDYVDAYKNRAILYSIKKDYLLANKDYEQLKILDSNLKDFYDGLIFLNRNQICNWVDYEKNLKRLEEDILNNKIIFPVWNILSCIDSPNIIKNNTQNYNNKEYNLNDSYKKKLKYPKQKKIRIGYYSADFRNHAVSYLMASVFECHDKNNFEIIGFNFSKYPDDNITKKISKTFDKFFDVRNISDQDIIDRSKELKIDIAIDLMGHTSDNRINIFINKVAPIQINFLGYPGTVGSYMDYIIADKYLIPNKNQDAYFEKIIYMPDSFQPHSVNNKINKNYDSKKFNLPESGFVYCCFNSSYKINPTIFNSWIRILKKTKNTVLCLLEFNKFCKDNLITKFSEQGIDVNRIFFLPILSYEDHLDRFKFCDLFLDTFPCGAHATANDALSMGLPLLSISGDSFQSRISSSLLKNLNMSELITENIKDYENLAIHLANNPEKLKEIKEKLISSSKKSNTFNAKIYTKNLEKAYKLIYENHSQNLVPKNIYIN